MRIPTILITGVEPDSMAALTVGLQWDLPHAVTVRHHIDVGSSTLHRTVSDVTGIVEEERIDLEHACVSCALREDVLPTLARLASDGRWQAVLAHLPVGAEARQVCRVIADEPRLSRHLRIAAVACALDGETAVDDLLGDALLRERGHHSSTDDSRGVGETLGAMVEYADVVAMMAGADPVARQLLSALARPDATLLADGTQLDSQVLTGGDLHRHEHSEPWVAPDRRVGLGTTGPDVWQVDLRSPRPLHPERLLADLARLGAGRHRSRGCFWLPTRPGRCCVWDGAGGQLSIGSGLVWQRLAPMTRLVLTGVGPTPPHLVDTFESMLVDPAELAIRGSVWEAATDGFEPWLGDLRRVA